MTTSALVGPVVGDPPSGRTLRREIARAANRRGGARLIKVLGDAYYAAVTFAIGMGLALGITEAMRQAFEVPARPEAPGELDVTAVVPWLLVAGTAVLVSLAGRLGPVGVGGAEATWLLGTPVDRRGLLRPAARRLPLLGALAGAAVVAVLDAGILAAEAAHVARASALGALAGALVVVLVGVAQSLQTSRRTVAGVADATLAAVPVGALVVALAGGRPALPATVPTALVVAVAVVLAAAAVVLDRRLGALRDRSLRESGSVAFQAAGAIVSLDSRELGRALSDATAPARRRRSWGFWRARGPRSAVVLADAAVVLRSSRHLAQVAVAAAVPVAVAGIPDLGGPWMFVVVVLLSGGVAASAAGEAARRADMQPAVDRLLPLSANTVRGLHLVVPTAVVLPWSLVTFGAVGVWWGTSLWLWGLLGVLVAPVWAAAAVRSAFRPPPDWGAALVATPMGALPAGVLAVVARGPDVAVMGNLAVVAAIATGAVSLRMIGVQMVVTLGCVAACSMADEWSLSQRVLGTGEPSTPTPAPGAPSSGGTS